MKNSYSTPSKLYLSDGSHILSQEGVTQGDNLATAKYAIASKPLIDELSEATAETDILQVWFADDGSGAGTLNDLKLWWEHLKIAGPKYGHHPKLSKTVLVLKNPNDLERANDLFNDGIKITTAGERHIGAVIGTADFKRSYVNEKVKNWIKDVEELAKIAEEEPQSALCAFNSGLSRRWAFLQRTVADIDELFEPLEDAIRSQLIPEIVGRPVNDTERDILALPYRYGGLGIQNPTQTASTEYSISRDVTSQLTNLILNQDSDVKKIDKSVLKEMKSRKKAEKEARFKEKVATLTDSLSENEVRSFSTAQEKGASSWLSALPIKSLGYSLNKQEFRDAICLRYGWPVKDAPRYCSCGKQNSTNHTLICSKG